jgi:hypothetical protein
MSVMSTLVAVLSLLALLPSPPVVSDHSDTPLLQSLARQDANITDLHVFTRGGNLVLSVATNPAIPPSVTQYLFPSDLKIRIFVDNDSPVSFSDPAAVATYGGTIVDASHVQPDVTFTIAFDDAGNASLSTSGLPGGVQNNDIQLFTGLRDDPFIRGPRIGRNSAAVVIELPLTAVVKDQSALLVWATTHLDGVGEPVDLAGRSLRSMFPENHALNFKKPKHHLSQLGLVPDVVIFDTAQPAAFPNGRELVDDVVDLVGDPRVLMNDQPFPAANDVAFLATFPYLAAPH